MGRELTFCQNVERSISKKYRKTIWNPFIKAIKNYDLISENDHVAACISGGKDSMLGAVLLRMLKRYSDVPFELSFIAMDPGYNEENRQMIEKNAALLELPVEIFVSDVFDIAYSVEKSPCYLCARMRRGHLYAKAKEMGANKIALGHHLSDAIETVLLSMFYGSQIQTMPPKLRSMNFEGMELIRPLYCIKEDDIISWKNYNGLQFIQCGCRFVEDSDKGVGDSKRKEIKELIRSLRKNNPDIDNNIFNSLHKVHIDTFPGFKSKGKDHSFLERYWEYRVQDGGTFFEK